MSQTPIQFGTDGWRAVVGQDFTIENIERVAAATALWLRDNYGPESRVLVGFDPRKLGEEAAQATARVLAASGANVLLSNTITPTPAVSWGVGAYDCAAGIVITASHNPPEYNGFKVKGSYGGSALPAMIEEIESHLPGIDAAVERFRVGDPGEMNGRIRIQPNRADYLDMLRQRFDIESIHDAGIRIVHDPMYGAGRGLFGDLLGTAFVRELHGELDSTFGGMSPEPIERNLEALPEAVRTAGFSAGIANDGDADRIGMCDENGRFVDSHRLLSLVFRHLVEDREESGDVVKTVSTTDMIDAMARSYGLTVHTTPIGFKYISGLFLDEDVLLGGEESGGLAVREHVPDRDGIFIGMLILEMMAHRKQTLSALVEDLYTTFGRFGYHRVDVHTRADAKDAALEALERSGGLKTIAGHAVRDVSRMDGYKHRMDDGWLLIRPSGTEPVLRIYSEASSDEAARLNVEDAVGQLGV